jgi:roadblock/LC7 domain-containing protein
MSEQQTPSYDPNKKYTWTPEDSFILSGGEFGLVLNALRAVLNTQEAARILIANEANKIVESALQRAVENGIAKEAEDSE